MSRKAAHTEAAEAQGRIPGRRGVWAAIRALQTFTRAELRLAVPHVSQNAVHEYLAQLVKAGFVQVGDWAAGQSRGAGKVRQYTLVRDIGVEAPRLSKNGQELPPSAQQLMWGTMKILGWFSPEELAAHAGIDSVAAGLSGTPEVRIPPETAREYARRLYLAGYLQASGDGQPRYRLIKDTGGLAPMIQRTKVVFDPNLNAVMWHEDIEP